MFNLAHDTDRIWLTDAQVEELTKKKQPAAQARVLSNSVPPIPYTMVAGRPVVQISDVLPPDSQAVKLNWE